MKEPSVKRNFFYSTFYQILSMVTPLITAPYVSRVLGADNIGIYSFTSSIQTYFALFAALGTASYGMREIARNRDDIKERSRLFWEIELLSVITSAVCIGVWGIFLLLQKTNQTIYLILTLNLINVTFDITWFYDGLEQFKYTVTKNSAVKIAGVVLILLFVRSHDDLTLYVLIMSLSTLVGTATMWITLPRFLTKTKIHVFNLKIHFHETMIYFIPTIASSIYTVLDKTLIGLITKSNYENGYYEQATKIVNMVKALTFTSLNSVLGARISYLFAEKKYDEIKQRIDLSIDYIFFMGLGCSFGIIGIADQFVPWFFGDGYEPVILLLRILSPIVVIIGLSNCLGSQYYSPAGYRKQSAIYIITGSVVNLCMNLVLIPVWKSAGAIIASLAAESVISFLYVKNCNGYLTLRQILLKLWKKLLAGLIMAVAVYLIGRVMPGDLTVRVVVEAIVGMIIYTAILTLTRDSFVTGFLKEQIQKTKRRITRG